MCRSDAATERHPPGIKGVTVNRGTISVIIGVLVIIILVILILRLA
ncbi:MAG: hypothetical protein WKF79_08630 [Nocardioides sp.]